MDVTKDNFTVCLPQVLRAIDDADFIAVDLELSGLHSTSAKPTHALDTVAERYEKLCQGTQDFLILQLGLCCFQFEPEQKKYKVEAFNFPVFPRRKKESFFLTQSSSFEFLCQHRFDFNKTFQLGVGFMRPDEEEYYRENIESKFECSDNSTSDASSAHKAKGPHPNTPVPPDQRDFVKKQCHRISCFLNDKNSTELVVTGINAFQRKLLYEAVQKRFGMLEAFTEVRNGERVMVIVRQLSPEEQKRKRDMLKKNELEELEIAVGISKIAQHISKKRKPLIGHNMMLDVLHITRHCLAELPQDYREFKQLMSESFPCIIDTKTMSKVEPFKSLIPINDLGELSKQLCNKPFRQPKLEFTNSEYSLSLDDENHHDAAFDAFITGVAFITMKNYLGSLTSPPVEHLGMDADLLKPFCNRINIMRTLDLSYFDLSNEEIIPDRSHVFHVTFPSTWKTPDVIKRFSQFGFSRVWWIDDTSSFISIDFAEKHSPESVIRQLSSHRLCRVRTYEEYHSSSCGVETPMCEAITVPKSDPPIPSNVSRKRRRASSECKRPPSVETIPEESEVTSPIGKESPLKKPKTDQTEEGNAKVNETKLFQETDVW